LYVVCCDVFLVEWAEAVDGAIVLVEVVVMDWLLSVFGPGFVSMVPARICRVEPPSTYGGSVYSPSKKQGDGSSLLDTGKMLQFDQVVLCSRSGAFPQCIG